MLEALRIAMLVFVAVVLLLLVGAMPGDTPEHRRRRGLSYLLVLLAYAALVTLYLSILKEG